MYDLKNQDRDYKGVNDDIINMENRYKMLSDDKVTLNLKFNGKLTSDCVAVGEIRFGAEIPHQQRHG